MNRQFLLLVVCTISSFIAQGEVCKLEGRSLENCRPPQFVNVSFDGSYNLAIWNDLIDFGNRYNSKFTFYVSGVTFLHRAIKDSSNPFSRNRYFVPGYQKRAGKVSKGRSRVLWARNGNESSSSRAAIIKYESLGVGRSDQMSQIQSRYLTMIDSLASGHEIGSHGNGHFYGGASSRFLPNYNEASVTQRKRNEFAYDWTREEWNHELSQFNEFAVKNLLLASLPKTYLGKSLEAWGQELESQMLGIRAPYLSTNESFFKALNDSGYVYDASTFITSHQLWPSRSIHGLWEYPLPKLSVAGFQNKILGMDFNFHEKNVSEDQAYGAWKKAFVDSYNGNRAPLSIGMHVYNMGPIKSPSQKGAYLRAMKRLISEVCNLPEVICGTYNQLTRFLSRHSQQIRNFENGRFKDAPLLKESAFRKIGTAPRHYFVPAREGQRGGHFPNHRGEDEYEIAPHDCSKFHGVEELAQENSIFEI